MKKMCDVCGEHEAVQIACSVYGATSYAFCSECLSKGLEPYGAVVSYIACAGHFPQDIRVEYVEDVRRMLPLWDKTEKEFVRDVETMIEKPANKKSSPKMDLEEEKYAGSR